MTSLPLTDAEVRAVRAALLAWSESTRRDLPWRATRDPWAVVVAEAMLQQTQVSRVVPRYGPFLARFPTVAAAAEARPGALVAEWAGLGYNRRALLLHRLAVAVHGDHGGVFPRSLAELRALPGVGPYTARAIMAFAFELDVAVVDTNVGRVLARLANRRLGPATAQQLADRLVPPGASWAWNQGVLDFGAGMCTARAPSCARCPLHAVCAWQGEGADPARGSAAVSRPQARFAGSDRQGRGRLVAELARRPLRTDEVPAAAGWAGDPERAARVMAALVSEGMVAFDGARYSLP